MRVFITGGTGLIGSRLVRSLVDRGDQPVVLTRDAASAKGRADFRGVEVVQGDPAVSGGWELAVDGSDAVINLAGENLFGSRWTPKVKRAIRDSRVYATENVVAAIARASSRPKALIQGSAIGYYGQTGDEELTESSPSGTDFMAVVCREWEAAAAEVEAHGTRLATIRTGIVLAEGAGALGVMAPIFKWLPLGAAPVGSGSSPLKPGTGQQWMSWIHLDDIVGLFFFALDHPSATGPLNGTAPNPVRNIEFGRDLARVLRRPFVPIGPPDLVLRLALGEVAQVVTQGQRVLPSKPRELGFVFRYPELMPALRAIFRGERAAAAPVEAAAAR